MGVQTKPILETCFDGLVFVLKGSSEVAGTRSPSSALLPCLGGRAPTKIDYRQKLGYPDSNRVLVRASFSKFSAPVIVGN